MVAEFADQCKQADYKLTLTGSWIEDREHFPGFWKDVYLYWLIQRNADQMVDNTLDLVNSDG